MYQGSVFVIFLFISCVYLQEIRQDVYVFHGQDLTVPCDEGQSCEFSTNVTVPVDIQNCKTTVNAVNVSFDQSKFVCNKDDKVKKTVTIHVLVTPNIYVKDSEGNRLDPGQQITVEPDTKEINLTFVAENGFPQPSFQCKYYNNYGNYVGNFLTASLITFKENGLFDVTAKEFLKLENSNPFEKTVTCEFKHRSFKDPKVISIVLKRNTKDTNEEKIKESPDIAVSAFQKNLFVSLIICNVAIIISNFFIL